MKLREFWVSEPLAYPNLNYYNERGKKVAIHVREVLPEFDAACVEIEAALECAIEKRPLWEIRAMKALAALRKAQEFK